MKEKINIPITFKVTETQYNEILRYAEEENRDKSDFVRHCVLSYIKKIKEAENIMNRK